MMTKSESHALCPKIIHGFMTYYERERQVPPGSPNHSMRESLSPEGLCAVFPAQGLGCITRVGSQTSPTLKTLPRAHAHFMFGLACFYGKQHTFRTMHTPKGSCTG